METIIFSTKKIQNILDSPMFLPKPCEKVCWISVLLNLQKLISWFFCKRHRPTLFLPLNLDENFTKVVPQTEIEYLLLLGIVQFGQSQNILKGEKNHELVTESIEFYEPLRYCFAIKSFWSFVVHISNIFNSFFSLRRYLRSFVKSVVKWNMENIADIVHGRDRLLT